MLSNTAIAEILDAAADYLDANGWKRVGCARDYSRPDMSGEPGAMSALAAIEYVITGCTSRRDVPADDPRAADSDQVLAYLDNRCVRLAPLAWFSHLPRPFTTWHCETDYPSKRPSRTKAEILAFLRAAAGELRATNPGDRTGDGDGGTGDGRGAELVCAECGEPARAVPPVRVPPWVPVPEFSHADGEPLCPVVGEGGYCPARPVTRDGWEREQ